MIFVPVLHRSKAQQHCSSPRQLSRKSRKSQSSARRIHLQVQRETSTSVSRQQSNAHRTVAPHLYSPPPSQLTSTDPLTGSRRPALQPSHVTGRSQSEDTNNPVFHHTYTASSKHPAYGIQTAPIPAVPRPDNKRGSSTHHFSRSPSSEIGTSPRGMRDSPYT